MKVSELAEELDVPPSAVIDQCQRFGIDASSAGAELGRSDAAVLRAELAGDADTITKREKASAASLPPTAVGSMPELFEGDDQGTDPTADTAAPAVPMGGFGFAGAGVHSEPTSTTGPPPRPPAARNRHFDHGLRSSALAFGLSAILLIGSNLLLSNPWLIGAAWLVAAIAIVFATVRAGQARYRASTHPERIRGVALATALTGLGVIAAIIFGLAAWTVVRAEPSKDAALGLGRPAAVTHLRWGWARLKLTADNGWNPVAKDPGSCWRDVGPTDDDAGPKRREERIEVGRESATCSRPHTYEVIDRWSVDRIRDTPYPGVPALPALGIDRCTAEIDRLNRGSGDGPPANATLAIEYPSATGWVDGDHDVTCVAQTAERRGPLTD